MAVSEVYYSGRIARKYRHGSGHKRRKSQNSNGGRERSSRHRERERRVGSYNSVLVSYLHILWLVADVMVFVWCGFYGLASFHGLRITTKRLTLRLCKNHTFDLCVTTVTEVNLASHWLECLT